MTGTQAELLRSSSNRKLVIAGQMDYRVPYTQGLSVFTALQRLGVPSEFLYFPDENHWVLKPANSILWYHTVLGWLDSHLKGVAPTNAPAAR